MDARRPLRLQILALLLVAGCLREYRVRPGHVAHARALRNRSRDPIALPARDADGREVFVDLERVHVDHPIREGPWWRVHGPDLRAGLGASGLAIMTLAFVIAANPTNIQPNDGVRKVTTYFIGGTGLGFVITGIVLDGPERPGSTPDMPRSTSERIPVCTRQGEAAEGGAEPERP